MQATNPNHYVLVPLQHADTRAANPPSYKAKRQRRNSEGAAQNTTLADSLDPLDQQADNTGDIVLPDATNQSRALIRLPRRAMPFVRPDPKAMEGLPKESASNPHFHTNQRGTPPVLPPTPFYSGTVYPRIVIPYDQLTGNIAQEQVRAIDKNPGAFRAVVPFGAGIKFWRENPTATADIKRAILSLNFADTHALEVVMPKPRGKNRKGDFEGPWPGIITNAPLDLMNYLTYHQTFSFSETLTFSVVEFDKTLQSWVLANLSGDAVKDDEVAKIDCLAAVKTYLWSNGPFCQLVQRTLAPKYPVSYLENVVRITDTFDLTYIHCYNSHGYDAPIFQLTGAPLSQDPTIQKAYLSIIRNAELFVNLHPIATEKRFLNCRWCKSESHPAYACPFPLTEGWAGIAPSPSFNTRDLTGPPPAPREGPNRGGRGGRGGRGSRGFKVVARR